MQHENKRGSLGKETLGGVGNQIMLPLRPSVLRITALAAISMAWFQGHPTFALADDTVAFEVASVKAISPRVAVARDISTEPKHSGDRVTWVATAQMMIRYAYDIRSFQLQERNLLPGIFEIQAKTGGPVNNERVRLMFQDLLRQRFKFQFHREDRNATLYTLTIARGGPNLTESIERMAAWVVNGTPAREGVIANHMSRDDRHHVVGRRVTVSQFAAFFAEMLGSVVHDQTGLTDYYDIELRWFSGDNAPFATPDPIVLSGAMQRKLGLRLDASRGPVETLVIDHLEQPSEN